ncbi:hypothetical protein ACI2LF_06620 [Kribbella sp. NPDC020789]
MEHAQFDAEYRRVVGAAEAGLKGAELAAELARLKELAATVDDESGRRDANFAVDMLQDAMRDGADDEPASETLQEIWRVHREATRYDGTTDERVARVEAGLAELERIAETAEPDEVREIEAYSHSMLMLLGALRPDVT